MNRPTFALALLLLTVASSAKAETAAQRTFEKVYRTGKAIEAATGVGVTYARFGELVQNFATEILVVKDQRLSELEQQVLRRYDLALSDYRMSLTVWNTKIQYGSRATGDEEIQEFWESGKFNLLTASALSSGDVKRVQELAREEAGRQKAKAELDETLRKARARRLEESRQREEAGRAAQARARAAEARAQAEAAAEKARLDAENLARWRETAAENEKRDAAEAERSRAKAKIERERQEAEHQRSLAEQVAEEFEQAERDAARDAKRPRPYEVTPGSWTCPRGYLLRGGKCLGDDEVGHGTTLQMGK